MDDSSRSKVNDWTAAVRAKLTMATEAMLRSSAGVIFISKSSPPPRRGSIQVTRRVIVGRVESIGKDLEDVVGLIAGGFLLEVDSGHHQIGSQVDHGLSNGKGTVDLRAGAESALTDGAKMVRN
jgi:hypothetical protein